MKTILCCLLFLVFIPTISYSLSDKEYNKLLSSSPEFKKYDAELNKLWKIVISKVPASMKKDLLNDQRFFVNKGREIDSSNVQYINLNRSNNDIPKIDRYILSTKKRIEELKMFLKFLENGSVMIEGKAQNIHDEAGGGYGVCRYVQEKDKDLVHGFVNTSASINCANLAAPFAQKMFRQYRQKCGIISKTLY